MGHMNQYFKLVKKRIELEVRDMYKRVFRVLLTRMAEIEVVANSLVKGIAFSVFDMESQGD